MNTIDRWSIVSITASASSSMGYKIQYDVYVEVNSEYWKQFSKKQKLGQLYGIDISNAVYQITDEVVPAYNPYVHDRARSKNGLKQIRLTYYSNDVSRAIKAGIEFHKGINSNEPKYGSFKVLWSRRPELVDLRLVR